MYDYVIVGAGSAGCVLAARLTEDPTVKVLLLEAGGSDRVLNVRAPGMYFSLWRSKRDWAFSTEPQEACDRRPHFWPRGKALGGSGSMNASLYVRGHRSDYDGWRDAGNPGWGWDDVLPYFIRSEKQRRGPLAGHGTTGLWDVDDQRGVAEASHAFAVATARVCGVAEVDDFNRGDSTGAGLYQVSVRDGERCSTATAFLEPARARPNLTIVTGAMVARIELEGTRARRVLYRVGCEAVRVEASREVVLCSGAIGSPQLLMLSGIGPAEHLRAAGVKVVVDLPGVGQNLQDHLMQTVTYESATSRPLSRLGLTSWLAQFAIAKRGPLTRSPVEAGGFVRTKPGLARPDLQFMFVPYPTDEPNTDEKRAIPFGRKVTILPSLLYPESRGEIRLRSSDPTAAPVIDPRYFSEPADLAVLVAGVKLAREIARTAPMAAHCGTEVRPGAAATSDDDLRANIRRHVNTIFHPVGTCAMGTVVDAELKVRGVDGLRIVDASVMPTIVGGNTNAPTVMIAEKAADLIARS